MTEVFLQRHGQAAFGSEDYDLGDIIGCWRKTADNSGEKPDDPADAFYYFTENALEAWTGNRLAGTRDSRENFNDQVMRAREDFPDSHAKRILVITSGGLISALLRDAMQLSFTTMIALNLDLANAGVTRLVLTGDRPQLVSFNTTSDLEIDGDNSLVSRL